MVSAVDHRPRVELSTECFWLHTCSNDHPNALSNYRKAGFEVFKEEIREWEPPAA